jgi:hypothetical protein
MTCQFDRQVWGIEIVFAWSVACAVRPVSFGGEPASRSACGPCRATRYSVPHSGGRGCTAELFGLAPDPTAIGSLGFLLLVNGNALKVQWLLRTLWIVPMAWCELSATVLWHSGLKFDLPFDPVAPVEHFGVVQDPGVAVEEHARDVGHRCSDTDLEQAR